MDLMWSANNLWEEMQCFLSVDPLSTTHIVWDIKTCLVLRSADEACPVLSGDCSHQESTDWVLPWVKTVLFSVAVLQYCFFLSLRATHVPGTWSWGGPPFQGGPLVRQWRWHQLVMAQIWNCFGLFASRAKTNCPLFFSITEHNAPLGKDAPAQHTPVLPPVKITLPVLERVQRQDMSLILLGPWWLWSRGI